MIFGWKREEKENNEVTVNKVKEVFANVLKINNKKIQILDIKWIGKKKVNRPMIVEFEDRIQKEFILERRGWFKGRNIRVEDDYNEEILKIRKELVEYMFKARSRGEYAVLSGVKLQVGEVKYDVEMCRKYWRNEEEDNKERKKAKERTNEEEKQEDENKTERPQDKSKWIWESSDKCAEETRKVRKGESEGEEIKTEEKMIIIKEANMGMGEREVIKCAEECKKTGESKIRGEWRGVSEELVGGEGQNIRNTETKLEEKLTRKKEEIKVRKEKNEERSITSKCGNWKLSDSLNTGYKDYCNGAFTWCLFWCNLQLEASILCAW